MKKFFMIFMAFMMLSFVSLSFATPPLPLQTATSTAIANPVFIDGGYPPGYAVVGGWRVFADGSIDVTSNAQGIKSANTISVATGTAIGVGMSIGIETDRFGLGASSALTSVYVVGAGQGLGVDGVNFSNNPDFASVRIGYEGMVAQKNLIFVNNGSGGTWAGGVSDSRAIFYGGSFNQSSGILDSCFPALAIGTAGGGAYASGLTIVSYVDSPNFASANSKTVGFSGYTGDQGIINGNGFVGHQAIAGSQSGSMGVSTGAASFGYEGTGNLGYGTAQTGGWTKIRNTPFSSTVTSFSSGSSSAAVGGQQLR